MAQVGRLIDGVKTRGQEGYEAAVAAGLSFPLGFRVAQWVQYRLGKLDQALDYLRRAYAEKPDPEIAAHLGEVLWHKGQRDEARKTWQDALERALSSLTGEPIRVALAGRTDAGVHALGQVAAFDTRSRHAARVFVQAVNHSLSPEIAVRAAREVAPDFDPRRRAISRSYRYTVYNGLPRPALLRRTVWQVVQPLDVKAMVRAARRGKLLAE